MSRPKIDPPVRHCGQCGAPYATRKASQKNCSHACGMAARRATALDPATIIARLMAHVQMEDRGYRTPCWIWQGHTGYWGYGYMGIAGRADRGAHIIAYSYLVGPVPEGLELDHLCRVTPCCNPEHLEPVSHVENMRRGVVGDVLRAKYAAQTHCIHGHSLADAYRHKTRRGHIVRHCRTCNVEWKRNRRAELRALGLPASGSLRRAA